MSKASEFVALTHAKEAAEWMKEQGLQELELSSRDVTVKLKFPENGDVFGPVGPVELGPQCEECGRVVDDENEWHKNYKNRACFECGEEMTRFGSWRPEQ